MLAVLIVILALFVLSTPYLIGIRRADRESERVFDRTAARLALDDAVRHARAKLDATHPAVDVTPYWDPTDELSVDNHLAPEFVNANDPKGVMWDLESFDLSGLVDLGSASPGVIANLIGQHTWLSRAATEEDASLSTASTRGFPEEGFLWVGGERMAYLDSNGSSFSDLQRDLFAAFQQNGAGGVNPDCDFSAPRAHDAGAPVLGLAAMAIPEWRTTDAAGQWRVPADLDQVASAIETSISGPIGDVSFGELVGGSTPFGGVGAGPRWQRGARLVSSVVGGIDCALRVDEAHYFNPGTTIRISNGEASELAIVREVAGSVVRLNRVLNENYDAFDAVVRPLARRPVNLNSAPPEVLRALFLGLKLKRKNARITDREADQLVEVVLDSRPFLGFEDFLGRIVRPAAGLAPRTAGAGGSSAIWADVGEDGFMDYEDAEALYKNGLNANDRSLEFSTMPFAFITRGTFELQLRSSINAKSGVQRASLERDQVEVMVPQKELLRVWSRQEDFDEALRLTRDAPLWATGPAATSRVSMGANPPSRFAAHFGSLTEGSMEGELAPGFASREENGWAQLWAVRSDNLDTDYHTRHVEHMDRETSDLEGRALGRAGAHVAMASDQTVEWSDVNGGGLLRPFSFSMWVKPERRSNGGLYFDLGDTTYQDTDRISVTEEAGELLVSVLDAGGDHPGTGLLERAEVRVPLEHFPLNTWTHLSIDIRGTRPDQVTVLVDGMARGETSGLTRLSSNLNKTATTIHVDSTEGFGAVGERCVVRIGDEVIEAEVMGPMTLLAIPNAVGVNAGIGGRRSRERERWDTSGTVPLNEGAFKDRNHPSLSPVQLFGYSNALRSEAPSGSTNLPSAIGPFAVAEVDMVVAGGQSQGESIELQGPNGAIHVGFGLRGKQSNATALNLRRGDDPEGNDSSFLTAFNAAGGYALLVQRQINLRYLPTGQLMTQVDGDSLGGMELIRYSGVSGSTLLLAGRGDVVGSELNSGPSASGAAASSAAFGARRAFVTHFEGVIWDDVSDANEELDYQVFVIPISLPAMNVFSGQLKFIEPDPGIPEYAQITRDGNDRSLTEWICYDKIVVPPSGTPPQFVRDHPDVLTRVFQLITRGTVSAGVNPPPPPPPVTPPPVTPPVVDPPLPPGPVTPPGHVGPSPPGQLPPQEEDTSDPVGGIGGGSTNAIQATSSTLLAPNAATALALPTPLPAPVSPARAQEEASALDAFGYWKGDLGVPEDLGYSLTRAVRQTLNFRGVMGTYSHAHPPDALILPVFRVWRSEEDVGIPGAGDQAYLLDENAGSVGEPVSIHRTYSPAELYPVLDWQSSKYVAGAGTTSTEVYEEAKIPVVQDDFLKQVFVALEEPIGIFLPPSVNTAGVAGQTGGPLNNREMRAVTRLVKYPSGELPRAVESIAIGGPFGNSAGIVPDAVVDELDFGATLFGDNLSTGESGRGAALLLAVEIGSGAGTIEIQKGLLRDARGFFNTGNVSPLSGIPEGGGLLRIGEELIAYQNADQGGTSIVIAPGGRGMLGTEEQPHRIGESIYFMSHLRTTTILGATGPADAELALADLHGLPESGTLLVGEELLHYTRSDARRGAGIVGMPRASEEPGEEDGEGGALFRGRFGTAASSHVVGTAALLFPTRYWDRWADSSDAPELSYFGFAAGQENAYWTGAFFEESESQHAGAQLGMLVRASPDVPWDADPDNTDGLWLFDGATDESTRLSLGAQSDLLEWRVFVRYEPGAFDFVSGLSHGWKTTPELRFTGAEFVAPRVTLYREDR